MFRAIFFQRENLDEPQVADVQVLFSKKIKEDLTQKTSTTFNVANIPSNIKEKDLMGIYDAKGKFKLWGVISAIGDAEITISQIQALYKDNHLLVPQTAQTQKNFFANNTVSFITDAYLKSKEQGFQSTKNNGDMQTFEGLIDKDVANMYKSIKHTIVDTEETHMPFPTEREVKDLETFLYDQFNSYNRIIRPEINTYINSMLRDYTELEYIVSTGTQFIKTNIIPNNYIKVNLKCSWLTKKGNWDFIFGSNTSHTAGSDSFGVSINNNGKFYLQYNGDHQSTLNYSLNTIYEIEAYSKSGEQYLKVNGNKVYNQSSVSYPSTSAQLSLFGCLTNNSEFNWGSNAIIYNCKIETNDAIRNFIPVKRNSDGAIGLLDLANLVFYENEGTGSFIAGPRKNSKINMVMFYPEGQIEYEEGKYWDYSKIKLFDTWENIQNLSITKETEDNNVVAIYNSVGTTLRGAYTVLNDGTIQQITTDTSYPLRIGANKTKFIFDNDNNLMDLAKANLPSLQYNHKIKFDIVFNDKYTFDYFNLGQPILFYSTKDNMVYDTILTAKEYSIDRNSDVIKKATFTLGKVRNDLSSKINLKKV